jgi:RNA polymerase sigma-70 factor (ECF subfamily)
MLMRDKHKYFETLYDAYWLEIKRFIYVEARRDAGLAEDIFQNTWENAFRYLHTLKDESKARAWLYSIAKNEAKRYFSNHRTEFFLRTVSSDDENGPDPEDFAESAFPEVLADADFLIGLLNRLSDEEQQLILLHYCYDMRLKEIAELYGTNYNTLKSVTRRAIEKLRAFAEMDAMSDAEPDQMSGAKTGRMSDATPDKTFDAAPGKISGAKADKMSGAGFDTNGSRVRKMKPEVGIAAERAREKNGSERKKK